MPPAMSSPQGTDAWFPIMRRSDNDAWMNRENHPLMYGWGQIKTGRDCGAGADGDEDDRARLEKQYPETQRRGDRGREAAPRKSGWRLSHRISLSCSARSLSSCSLPAPTWPTFSPRAARRGRVNLPFAPRSARRARASSGNCSSKARSSPLLGSGSRFSPRALESRCARRARPCRRGAISRSRLRRARARFYFRARRPNDRAFRFVARLGRFARGCPAGAQIRLDPGAPIRAPRDARVTGSSSARSCSR